MTFPSIELPQLQTNAAQIPTQTPTQQATGNNNSIFDTVKTEVTNWISDADKVCEDGIDDGKLSRREKAEYFGKGLLGIAKTAVKHPVITGLTVAAGAALALNPITGPALLAAAPAIAGAGAIFSAGTIAYGGYKASQANNDAEAKQAWETIGNGTFGLALAGASAGKALNAASKAGVAACDGLATSNPVTNTINCIKTTPQALAQSAANLKADYLTATTGVLQANSNILRTGSQNNQFMSKANEVQAYRFNPNGTPDEILANNPNVFMGEDGKFYLPNKWNPNEPYLIDTTKEQMIMMYGPDDMAVCDGKVFGSSYVDTNSFKGTGARNYQNPANLPYGEVVDVTKQAAGAYMIAPEGTQVQSLEGIATVNKGDVIAVDTLGNPYTQPAMQTATKNTGFTIAQQEELLKAAGIDGISTIEYDPKLGYRSVEMTVNGQKMQVDFNLWNSQEISNITNDVFNNIKGILKAAKDGVKYLNLTK